MKRSYKELRKKLTHKFTPPTDEYGIVGSVEVWVSCCGIKPLAKHTEIICKIFGSVPYPYQKADRAVILEYLKKNKYKDFKRFTLSIT